jgi:hypothetical protein
MTFISMAEATSRLGIDAKTLRRWLAEAQLPLHRSASDARKKAVSEEHLERLARRHQRSLAPLPEESAAPAAGVPPELSAVPEQLAALQAQLSALQHQVADLTLLLQQPTPPPVCPASPTQPGRTSRRSSTPAHLAPRSRRAANTPRKPVHVIPRVEYGKQGRYVVICPKQGLLPFEPDTPEWFAWVAQQSSFRFVGKGGHFTAHHWWRVPRGAWRAHRQIRNHSYNLRLAPTQELTMARLEQAAMALQAHLT